MCSLLREPKENLCCKFAFFNKLYRLHLVINVAMYKQNGKRFDSTHSSYSRPSGQGELHDTSNAFIMIYLTQRSQFISWIDGQSASVLSSKLLRRARLHRHPPANRWRHARRVHAAPEDEDARVQTKERTAEGGEECRVRREGEWVQHRIVRKHGVRAPGAPTAANRRRLTLS